MSLIKKFVRSSLARELATLLLAFAVKKLTGQAPRKR
jgi:hypothetical protein